MAVETAVVQCTSRWAMARGHRLNTSIVLAVVHSLPDLFWAVSTVEPSLFRPLPPLSPSLISHLASVDVKQNVLEGQSQSQDTGNGCLWGKVKVHPAVQSIIWHNQLLFLSKVYLAVQSITWHYQWLSWREVHPAVKSHGTINGCP